jgi:glutamyl-tRNA reductase
MQLRVTGLSHKTADVELRERLSVPPEKVHGILGQLEEQGLVEEAILLSTCNRTEIYYVAGESLEDEDDVMRSVCESVEADFDEVRDVLYEHRHLAAAEHCFRVAGSLDSMVVGETQILGQVKDAYRRAREGGFCDKFLHELFQNAFHIAKKIRSRTNISRLPSSVGSAAVALARQIFGELRQKNVLVIGGGDMGRLCLEHLREEGVEDVHVTNRTYEKARSLADNFDGEAHEFDQLEEGLLAVDIVISSTGASEPVLRRDHLESIRNQRGSRPLFIIDIAVPRDVSEDVRDMENVYLYNIDDLESVVERNMDYRETEMDRAEKFIQEGVEQFDEWLKTQDMGPMIRELKQEVYQLVEQQLREELQPGEKPPEKSDIQLVAHRVTNKLLNDPLNVMKEKAVEGDHETIAAIREIFDLDEELPKGA